MEHYGAFVVGLDDLRYGHGPNGLGRLGGPGALLETAQG